ncbi:MAG TPA: amidohydrolase family protein [Bryobacteraceae bacterium]|jgi:predicted TIM-barrel fold metal-dependent hydrolase|nr:amidohydrolase family protein [Bryobacteraceae bacterium]
MLRREFLAGMATLAGGSLAKGAPTPHRIDVHHHLFPPAYRTAIGNRAAGQPAWSPAQSVEEMDKGGIATSVLSVSSPGVWFGDVQEGRRVARIVNDYGAMTVKDHPGRFGLFAALPLPDIDGSLREIEYALDTLKADGIGLLTDYGDKWLGDASFAPVWTELNRRKAVIYTHPTTAACCGNLKNEVPAVMIEWATDTTRTIASLLFSGTAARYPDIRWIFSHGGGTMPFLLSRFVYQEATMKGKESVLPKGLMYELKKFHYDTAQANSAPALAALLKVAPLSQILFGTDYPFRTSAEEIGGLTAQRFATKDLRAIERDNALRLLPELQR